MSGKQDNCDSGFVTRDDSFDPSQSASIVETGNLDTGFAAMKLALQGSMWLFVAIIVGAFGVVAVTVPNSTWASWGYAIVAWGMSAFLIFVSLAIVYDGLQTIFGWSDSFLESKGYSYRIAIWAMTIVTAVVLGLVQAAVYGVAALLINS